MLSSLKPEATDARVILSALAAWAVSALALLCLASFILGKVNAGEGAMGYISSALSFLTAICAGAAVGKSRAGSVVYMALLTAAVLVTALLTIGFMVEGTAIDASGVLSVVSFTFAGCLAGAMLFTGKKQKNYKQRYRR